jgi:hypothetical protein
MLAVVFIMKKIISRLILGALFISLIGALLWRLIIHPCIELGSKHGILGIGAWFITLAIVGCVIYCILKIIDWCIDNA